MIWNDRTSGYLSRGGQMGTHDEFTEEFFADSQVQVNPGQVQVNPGQVQVNPGYILSVYKRTYTCKMT